VENGRPQLFSFEENSRNNPTQFSVMAAVPHHQKNHHTIDHHCTNHHAKWQPSTPSPAEEPHIKQWPASALFFYRQLKSTVLPTLFVAGAYPKGL
jgi:hypothetical protein